MSTYFFYLPFVIVYGLGAVYAERKISAFIQDRMGPMETGKYGWIQTAADILKLLMKENIVPAKADKVLFLVAPVIIFVSIFAGFAVVPINANWHGAGLEAGVFYLLAIVSLDVVGILMAGWGSNSKFALFGAIRSVSQIISYAVPLGISVLCAVMLCQSLNLQEICYQQGILIQNSPTGAEQNYLLGVKSWGINTTEIGGFLTWNIFRMPLMFIVFIIFFIASLAESNRAPFDIPEAEAELVAGFHTEYSGFRFAVIMLSEYVMMMLSALLAAILFFGGWNTPLPNIGEWPLAYWTTGEVGTLAASLWGIFWLLSKALLLVGLQMAVRWTYPRLRVDQLMSLCWKYLTPAALILLFLCGLWRMLMI